MRALSFRSPTPTTAAVSQPPDAAVLPGRSLPLANASRTKQEIQEYLENLEKEGIVEQEGDMVSLARHRGRVAKNAH